MQQKPLHNSVVIGSPPISSMYKMQLKRKL